jgi:putative ATPase
LVMTEVAGAIAESQSPTRPFVIEKDAVEMACEHRHLSQSNDTHYDQASALIKSIRGSDIDASLYWMARLLRAGEDPRFIARRLVILASEDIGLADSMALVVAVATFRACEVIGLPEATLNLAHGVTYLAKAPKSNKVAKALSRAFLDVDTYGDLDVPALLRDGHYQGASDLGHGVGYVSPHTTRDAEITYRPDVLEGNLYYEDERLAPDVKGSESR